VDPRGLQGRQLVPYVHIVGAGRTYPIAIIVTAILAELNGLQLLAPAALLGDLVNMADALFQPRLSVYCSRRLGGIGIQ
jgi:hypothetical protein